ncbi:hypothetical protein BJ912DRAFT_908519, partial [Pholiota molesta]
MHVHKMLWKGFLVWSRIDGQFLPVLHTSICWFKQKFHPHLLRSTILLWMLIQMITRSTWLTMTKKMVLVILIQILDILMKVFMGILQQVLSNKQK